MRYSLLGILGITSLVAILAATQRALGVVTLAIVMHAVLPMLLWCVLLVIHFASNETRLGMFRVGLIMFAAVFAIAPLVGVLEPWQFFYQIAVMVFFWGIQYLAVVSWTEG